MNEEAFRGELIKVLTAILDKLNDINIGLTGIDGTLEQIQGIIAEKP